MNRGRDCYGEMSHVTFGDTQQVYIVRFLEPTC
jgi:hypothetical protein